VPTTMTPEEAAGLLGPTDTLAFGLGPSMPPAVFEAMGARTDWTDLVIGGALALGSYDLLSHPGVSYRCGFYGPVEKLLASSGARIDLVPSGFRQFRTVLEQFSPRVMAVQGAPGPNPGDLNLSLHMGGIYHELLRAGRDPDRLVIAEVNDQLPRTGSRPPKFSNVLPADSIDVIVPVSRPPLALPRPEGDDAVTAIAELATSYIVDGTTLQTGIGAIPGQIAARLAERDGGDYGIHTELFSDGLMDLHRAGKVTNRRKGVLVGQSVATFSLGTQDLYSWLDGNEDVAFLPVEVVNDPSVIARNHRMVSIEGALAVDLYGQIAADSISGRQVSGVGGHEDFMAGPELRADSHALICLPSTVSAGGGTLSRIVEGLEPGTIVSTPRHHADVVITEFGVAELRGLTVTERARALARIAHPDFRGPLSEAAEILAR
jgi:acyl-CoA hydrolase